jgi:GNAT superfamily N-acetyltransferase
MTTQPAVQHQLKVVPAAPEHWTDIEAFFSGNPCWCQSWRMPSGAYGRSTKEQLPRRIAGRRNALHSQLKGSTPPAVLAYQNNQIIGWCGFGPRSEMERLVRSRTIPAVDDLPVWSIVCFLIHPGFRRQGVTKALLRGAIECAREYGAPALEAYPVDPGGKRIDTAFSYVGILSMFEREGFQRIVETSARSAGLSRWLVRLDLAPVS